jgi:transcriptional regulator with XRE-family HTH domain
MNSNQAMLAKLQTLENQLYSATKVSTLVSATAALPMYSAPPAPPPAVKATDPPESNTSTYQLKNYSAIANPRRKVLSQKLKDKKYRDAYVKATVTHGIAHQIRVNRQARGLSQQALAELCHPKTTQAVISRLEDTANGKFNIASILKIASALDVAVIVKLVPFSKFLLETDDKTVAGLTASSFQPDDVERGEITLSFTNTTRSPAFYTAITLHESDLAAGKMATSSGSIAPTGDAPLTYAPASLRQV